MCCPATPSLTCATCVVAWGKCRTRSAEARYAVPRCQRENPFCSLLSLTAVGPSRWESTDHHHSLASSTSLSEINRSVDRASPLSGVDAVKADRRRTLPSLRSRTIVDRASAAGFRCSLLGWATQAELLQGRHPIIQTDFLRYLAVFDSKHGHSGFPRVSGHNLKLLAASHHLQPAAGRSW